MPTTHQLGQLSGTIGCGCKAHHGRHRQLSCPSTLHQGSARAGHTTPCHLSLSDELLGTCPAEVAVLLVLVAQAQVAQVAQGLVLLVPALALAVLVLLVSWGSQLRRLGRGHCRHLRHALVARLAPPSLRNRQALDPSA